MTKAVILGISGENGLWLADLESGTITAIKEPLTDELAKAESLRGLGVSLVKGVDFAVVVSTSVGGAASLHESNG